MDETRQEYSDRRLAELRSSLEPLNTTLDGQPICVYATGSYGRGEAWPGSDIDLFFLFDDRGKHDELPFLSFIKLTSALISRTEAMGFPPFSGDGKFLEVRNVSAIERVLGSPDDDSTNAFTARLLLLLESTPVYDAELYRDLLAAIVGFYYRDFEGHDGDFAPNFLINDILRFWRTLTLNYEHDRLKLKLGRLVGEERERRKAKSALKNYKLKFSRMATCFSMVANLASEPTPVTAETVLDLCTLTPTERFARLSERSHAAAEIVKQLEETYAQFLDCTQRSDAELLVDFTNEVHRDDLLQHANSFGDMIFELLRDIVDERRYRYLVI